MPLRRLKHTAYMAWHLRRSAVSAFRPAEAVARERRRRVRRMVAYAWRHVPWYREAMDRLGLAPTDFHDADDLAKLPLIERENLQRTPEKFQSTDPALVRVLTLHSGGSTGMPVAIPCDALSLFHSAVQSQRERDVIAPFVGGVRGYREVLIAPDICSTISVRQFCYANAWFPRRVPIERLCLSLLAPPEEVLDAINRFQPDVVHSYGSYLGILFRHLQQTGGHLHRPKAILYGSDGLAEPVRHAITGDFGIPVFSVYGCIEAFRIAVECEQHAGQHVNEEWFPVRIVDAAGKPVPDGEEGEVVVSNLVNRATVLLNYRLDDIASLLPEPCPCGRPLPLLSFVNGRRDDLVHLPSGRLLHSQAIRVAMLTCPPVWEYQVVQETLTRFRIDIVPATGTDHDALRAAIHRMFSDLVDGEADAEITIVDSLERTRSGKHRPVISKVAIEGDA